MKTTPVNTPSAATNAARRAVVTFGPRSSEPLSRSELLSWLLSAYPASSTTNSSRPALSIGTVILHCSDTRPTQHYTIGMLSRDHARRGFGAYPGYHFYITRDGTLYYCRPLHIKGCHVKGHNTGSIGVCYEGGRRCPQSVSPLPGPLYVCRDEAEELTRLGVAIAQGCTPGKPARASPEEEEPSGPVRAEAASAYEDNRTAEQCETLHHLLTTLHAMFPQAVVRGHRDFAAKACPCFDARREYAYIFEAPPTG